MVAPAWRFWRRRPGQLLWLSATLGLGVGGFVAALAIADALWLRPLPVDEPDRLVFVAPYTTEPLPIDDATVDVWRQRAEPFEAISVYGFESPTEIRTPASTERARVAASVRISSTCFGPGRISAGSSRNTTRRRMPRS